jgi:hypothetical protein
MILKRKQVKNLKKEGTLLIEISLESEKTYMKNILSNFHHLKARNNIKSYRKIC